MGQLTTAQLATIKANILATPALLAFWNAGNPDAIAQEYNKDATPAFVVWKTSLSVEQLRASVVWTEVDSLTVGKARIWDWATQGMTQSLNPSDVNIRQGLADCWGAATTTRANLLAAGKRDATVIEKLLATGTGTTASPATMGFEGRIEWPQINAAFGV